jgi:large subunit ribosomal protein L24
MATEKKKKKYHVRKGDLVEVISGGSKGSRGKILRVDTDSDRVLVEGVNMHTKHQKPTQENQQGGRVKIEMPIHISNVLPIDPKSDTPTRIGRKKVEVNGVMKSVRVAKKSGETLS